jgi:hypothetical protein
MSPLHQETPFILLQLCCQARLHSAAGARARGMLVGWLVASTARFPQAMWKTFVHTGIWLCWWGNEGEEGEWAPHAKATKLTRFMLQFPHDCHGSNWSKSNKVTHPPALNGQTDGRKDGKKKIDEVQSESSSCQEEEGGAAGDRKKRKIRRRIPGIPTARA